MNRQELLNKLDNMIIYEKDYDTLNNLVKYCSPKLFTKIIEEIFLGNLYISDFDSVFPDDVSDKISKHIVSQIDIENRYYNLLALRNQLDINSTFKNNIAIAPGDTNYKEELEFAKKNLISDLFETDEKEDSSVLMIKELLYDKLMKNPTAYLASRYDYLVPVEYKDVVLDKYDYDFADENHLSEDDIRKMKSLSMYLISRGK